jgi:hypothetical protein
MERERLTIFSNVIYKETVQRALINEIFSVFEDNLRNDKDRQNLLYLLILALAKVLPLLKTQQHTSDNECRIVQIEGFNPPVGGVRITPFISKQIECEINRSIKIFKY